jgi:osmotically inducible lipoprotein OsmB
MVTKKLIQACVAGLLAIGLQSAAFADDKTRNAIIGAGLGGVAGALISEGDPLYTAGGAAAGGVLGHVMTSNDRDRKRHHWDRDRKHNNGHYHHKKRGHKRHKHHR